MLGSPFVPLIGGRLGAPTTAQMYHRPAGGGIGVVSPIYNAETKRAGFS
jgi:hypothetical protein